MVAMRAPSSVKYATGAIIHRRPPRLLSLVKYLRVNRGGAIIGLFRSHFARRRKRHMFAAIRRGFGFLGQAIDMARRDSDLIKPSLYGLVVGTIVSVAGALPTIVVALLVGGTPTGRVGPLVFGGRLLFFVDGIF